MTHYQRGSRFVDPLATWITLDDPLSTWITLDDPPSTWITLDNPLSTWITVFDPLSTWITLDEASRHLRRRQRQARGHPRRDAMFPGLEQLCHDGSGSTGYALCRRDSA
jgi:hypothetical protein